MLIFWKTSLLAVWCCFCVVFVCFYFPMSLSLTHSLSAQASSCATLSIFSHCFTPNVIKSDSLHKSFFSTKVSVLSCFFFCYSHFNQATCPRQVANWTSVNAVYAYMISQCLSAEGLWFQPTGLQSIWM